MQNLSVVLVDANGVSTIVLLHLTDAALLTDGVAAISNGAADWTQYWGSTAEVNPTPTPGTGTYLSVLDVADLYFSAPSGDWSHVVFPSPSDSMFMADGETVDPADPTGVLAALGAILTTAQGEAVTGFAGGMRRRR